MIDRRAALSRTLRGFLERNGVLRDEIGMRYLADDTRRVGANFRCCGRAIFTQIMGPSEDQYDVFDGEILPTTRLVASIDGALVIKGQADQDLWSQIVAACTQVAVSAATTSSGPSQEKAGASMNEVPIAAVVGDDEDDRRIAQLIEQWAVTEPEPAGELAALVSKKLIASKSADSSVLRADVAPVAGAGKLEGVASGAPSQPLQWTDRPADARGKSLASRFRPADPLPPRWDLGEGWA